MSAQITNNNNYGNIRRMFARQNVGSVYGAQKSASGLKADEEAAQVDKVSLSAFAPRPLNADFLEDAMAAGKTLQDGGKLSAADQDRLREDRVFAAVTALALLGYDEETGTARSWPGGLPSPSAAELEEARRRLAQRPRDTEAAQDYKQVQRDRLDLMQKVGKKDLSAFGYSDGMQVAPAAEVA